MTPTTPSVVVHTRFAGAQLPDLRVRQAQLADVAAVVALFGELHQYNASLDPQFALVENWATLLRCRFEETIGPSRANLHKVGQASSA